MGWLISLFLDALTFGVLGIASYSPLAVGAFAAPFLFLSSIHVFVHDGLFSDAWRIKLVLEYTQVMAIKLILPVITFGEYCFLPSPFTVFLFFSWHLDTACILKCVELFQNESILIQLFYLNYANLRL